MALTSAVSPKKDDLSDRNMSWITLERLSKYPGFCSQNEVLAVEKQPERHQRTLFSSSHTQAPRAPYHPLWGHPAQENDTTALPPPLWKDPPSG